MPDRFIYWTLHINIDRHEAIYFPLYSGSKDVLHYEYLSTVTNTCVFFLVVFREGNFQIENHQKWKQSVFFYFLASEGFHAKLRLLIVMFEIRVRERKCHIRHQVYQKVLKKKELSFIFLISLNSITMTRRLIKLQYITGMTENIWFCGDRFYYTDPLGIFHRDSAEICTNLSLIYYTIWIFYFALFYSTFMFFLCVCVWKVIKISILLNWGYCYTHHSPTTNKISMVWSKKVLFDKVQSRYCPDCIITF